MTLFVNREKELDVIEKAVQTLKQDRLLSKSIIEIHGAGGMGKTALLKQVEQYCHNSSFPCISIDIAHASANLEHDLLMHIGQHMREQSSIIGQTALSSANILLKEGPAVMLFDGVDSASPDQLNVLQRLLRGLIHNEKLCVVLASKKSWPFLEKERSLAPNLTQLSLQSLPREDCEHFLNSVAAQIATEIRGLIIEWTKGYPLAMNVMVDAINSGLDPLAEPGKREILTRLKDLVIYQEILGDIEPDKRAYYYSLLQLFSLPRRFNLIVIQDLIEEFLPELKRHGSILAYLSLPKDICDKTDVMRWNVARAGYAVDDPVRMLFLLILKQEQPDRYLAIHTFLAGKNWELAHEVPGSDRVRYLREYLYHLVNSQTPPDQSLLEVVEMVSRETPEVFVQFSEELAQDHEFQEALGQQFSVVETAIHTYQAKMRSDKEDEG